MPVACITGASSGIGLETARLLHAAGFTVYGLSTSTSGSDFLCERIGDVTKARDVSDFISWVMQGSGRIDVLINSAGISIASPVEYTRPEDWQRLFDVNLFGTITICQAVLPFMRENRGGQIINIASVAGVFPLPYESFYSSSKAALISFSRALRSEVKDYGIQVTAMAPGGVRTHFTFKRMKYKLPNTSPYFPGLERMIRNMDIEEQTGLWPQQVAKAVVKVVLSRKNSPVCVVGGIYKWYLLLGRLLPYRWLDRIISFKYRR